MVQTVYYLVLSNFPQMLAGSWVKKTERNIEWKITLLNTQKGFYANLQNFILRGGRFFKLRDFSLPLSYQVGFLNIKIYCLYLQTGPFSVYVVDIFSFSAAACIVYSVTPRSARSCWRSDKQLSSFSISWLPTNKPVRIRSKTTK